MKVLTARGLSPCCALACVVLWSGAAVAEEEAATAAESSQEQEQETPAATTAEEPRAATPAATDQAASAAPRPAHAVPDAVVRRGRVEMVLIENQDPESALEFGQELLAEDGDSARLRMLLAACLMTMGRASDAIPHLDRAAEMSRDDASVHLRVLYNIGRAHQAAGHLREAATAYDRYVAFARSHQDLPSFTAYAERLARVLRTRAEAAPSP